MDIVIIILGVIAVAIVLILLIMALVGRQKNAATSTQLQPNKTRAALMGGAKAMPSASVNRRSNWLQGIEGAVKDKTYHIGARSVTMGRKVGNYIQLIDDNVSRVHIKIVGRAQGIEVIDQGSQTGTMVNDTRLTPRVPHILGQHDRLKIGKNVFVFFAQADFKVNHGLTDQKIAGNAQLKQTAALGALNWKQELADALVKAGGDRAKAAELMGVSQEIFDKMLESTQ